MGQCPQLGDGGGGRGLTELPWGKLPADPKAGSYPGEFISVGKPGNGT